MTRPLRVISLLPSATETLCILGGRDLLVGRNHEDDFPRSVLSVPSVTGQKTTFTNSKDVDKEVAEALSTGQSLYTLNGTLVKELKPDIILTQDICNVCAIDLVTVERLALTMDPPPKIVSLNPLSLSDVLSNILQVGEAVNLLPSAERAHELLQSRVTKATAIASDYLQTHARKKVILFEWISPPYPAGHWSAELIHLAGGEQSVHPHPAGSSKAVQPQLILESKPEYIIVAACGLDIPTTLREVQNLENSTSTADGWWKELLAQDQVKKVLIVDGNQMFNRPSGRIVDALEFLVGILWGDEGIIPSDFPWVTYAGKCE
ncbi:hypothetical protein HDU85_007751 [Gaertneriomyces sp. JEL0708]|nr:hypothetical protein HDU85_007751 [Gaertneriomyces sp. JEL0708]